MVGHEKDWDDCDFGEVASQRAEDLSGRTKRSTERIQPDAGRSTDMEMGDVLEKEVSTVDRAGGSEGSR
jgi:hypothetical protein